MKRRTVNKSKGKKALIAGGVLVTGGALYFAWDKFFKKNNADEISEDVIQPTIQSATNLPVIGSPRNDKFPLKRGSLGNRVRLLQTAVQKVLGKGRFPDSEIDGDYGTKTESAVIEAGFPVSIDEATFNRITSSASVSISSSFNARTLSSQLYNFAASRDLNGVLSVLRHLKNPEDYKSVNQYFVAAQVLSVSKSIVTYLLDLSFPSNEYAKKEIRKEFLRIGLRSTASDPINQNGSWSLSGFKKDIITITSTYVNDKLNRRIPVQEKTILGEVIRIKNGLTYFKGLDGQVYSVPTIRVRNT